MGYASAGWGGRTVMLLFMHSVGRRSRRKTRRCFTATPQIGKNYSYEVCDLDRMQGHTAVHIYTACAYDVHQQYVHQRRWRSPGSLALLVREQAVCWVAGRSTEESLAKTPPTAVRRIFPMTHPMRVMMCCCGKYCAPLVVSLVSRSCYYKNMC